MDEYDILPIGIYFNELGSPRKNKSFEWKKFYVAKCDSGSATFVDANGDGVVDARDVIGIGVNWGNIHEISGDSYKVTDDFNFSDENIENLTLLYSGVNGTDKPSVEIRKLLEKILRINTPKQFSLSQNHPNPFNSKTTIVFNLPSANTVSIRIFDLLGREISVITDEKYYRAGTHSVQINSDLFSSGVYFYEVQSGDTVGAISEKFGISVNTILWGNDLSARSYIRPGDSLKILPVSGLVHQVKRGDTVSKIARTYDVEVDVLKINSQTNRIAMAGDARSLRLKFMRQ